MTLVMLTGGLALWHYQRIALELLNPLLAPYKTQIIQLSFRPLSLNQWHVSSLALTVDNSDLKITDLTFLLDKNTKPWAFKVSDLQALSVEKINVQLAPSALTASSQNTNETGPTIGLNFDAFPDIKLKQTHIVIKGLDKTAPSLELKNLSLNKFGELESQIKVDDKPLLSLSAKLTSEQWSANTSIDLTLLQSFSRRLEAIERTFYNNRALSHSEQQRVSLLSPLYQLNQTLDSKKITLDAILDSTLKLNLKTATLSSEHSLRDTKVVLNELANFTLQPITNSPKTSQKKPGQKEEQKPQENLGKLNFKINGHIATPVLTVMPFKLPLTLKQDNEQLEQLLNRLNDKPFEQALKNLYQELSLNPQSHQKVPSLLFSLDDGLIYRFEPKRLSVPQLSLSIINSRLDAALLVSSLSYQFLESHTASTTNDYKLTADWQLKAVHEHSLSLNKLWPKLTELPYQIKIGQASLEMQGELMASQSQGQPHYRITIASGATQTTKGVTLSNPDNLANRERASSQLNTNIGHTQLTLNSPLEYSYFLKQSQNTSQTKFTLPALSYRVTDLTADLQLNNALEQRYKLQLDNINLSLQQAIPLMLTANNGKERAVHDEEGSSLVSQLLSHDRSNQIDLRLTQLKLDKSGYNRAVNKDKSQANKHKRRHIKQKLAHFNTIELSQNLRLSHQRIHSDESWQVNDLYLTSQHQFAPEPNHLSRFTLVGDWQFESGFAPILAFLSQTDSLPDSLDIKGNAKLAMHYQLKKDQQLTFDLNLAPQVSDIQGSLSNLPFDGGSMDTQCKFSWQQDSSDKRESVFKCDNIKLSLQAFNPGILITDIEAEAAVAFETESEVTEQPENAVNQSKENLALAQQLLGVKQASVGLTAKGSLLGGQLLIPQFQLNLNKPSSAYFVLQHIDLEKLLAIQPQVGIHADGIFDGVLPVSIDKGKASVSGGRLAARAPGGLIAIGNNPAVEQMRQSQPYLEFAFSALEHLNYSELASSFDMDAQGDATLKVNVKGRSRGIERPIHFNYSQEENMLQLLRSLQIGDNLQNQIERAVK